MPPPDGPAAKVTDRGSGRPVKVVLTSDPKPKSLSMRQLLKGAAGPGAKKQNQMKGTEDAALEGHDLFRQTCVGQPHL